MTRRSRASRLAWLLLLAGALAGSVGWVAWRHETRAVRLAAGAPTVELVVPPGASAEAIGRELESLDLVRHPLVFRLLVRSRGLGGQLKAGEYALNGPLSLEEIVDLLVRGEVVRREVTIPEGRTLEETAALVGAGGLPVEDFLAAADRVFSSL